MNILCNISSKSDLSYKGGALLLNLNRHYSRGAYRRVFTVYVLRLNIELIFLDLYNIALY